MNEVWIIERSSDGKQIKLETVRLIKMADAGKRGWFVSKNG